MSKQKPIPREFSVSVDTPTQRVTVAVLEPTRTFILMFYKDGTVRMKRLERSNHPEFTEQVSIEKVYELLCNHKDKNL